MAQHTGYLRTAPTVLGPHNMFYKYTTGLIPREKIMLENAALDQELQACKQINSQLTWEVGVAPPWASTLGGVELSSSLGGVWAKELGSMLL